MFRTTRWASLLVGTLALLTGAGSTLARPVDPPHEPYSIVAQSTKATAATGRRPISQRIAASNLPLRAPAPPDCAQGACHDEALAVNDAVPMDLASSPTLKEQADVDGDAGPDTVAEVAAAVDSAETRAPSNDSDAVEAEAVVASETAGEVRPPLTVVQDDMLAQGRPTNPVMLPSETAAPIEQAEVAAIDLEAEAAGRIEATPSLVMPVAAPAPSAPPQTVRDTLLKRIKGALTTRQRAPTPPAAAPGAAPDSTAAATTPLNPATGPRSAPRPISIPHAGNPAVAIDRPTPADEADAATSDSATVEDDGGAVPARLEFDVRESRSLVGEGEQIVMRIAVRNVGGETAERVTATLFFAEGIEPVQAIGQSAEVYPGEVRFEAVPRLSPGSSVDLLVTAVGTRPGSVTYRGELECRQLAGRIAREGAVTVRAKRAVNP